MFENENSVTGEEKKANIGQGGLCCSSVILAQNWHSLGVSNDHLPYHLAKMSPASVRT